MKRVIFIFSLTLGAAASCTAFAASSPMQRIWIVDPVHSSAEFSVKHLGFFHVKGTIPIKNAQLATGPSDLTPVTIAATLDPSGVDTKNDDRDKDLRSDNFFDVKRYPVMSFKSTKIIAGENGNLSIIGDLTLHGVTKQITLIAHFEGQSADARGRQRIGYTGSAHFDRRDFGMKYGEATPGGALIVGNDIRIDIAVEAVQK
ncbi:MAG: YceI family protein [Candidatus Eremiobacteraeota bacterium]|nr:YceI family protein [Candidatus Eremiobacteraeota bacterium]